MGQVEVDLSDVCSDGSLVGMMVIAKAKWKVEKMVE
jgi:hypothetical protein